MGGACEEALNTINRKVMNLQGNRKDHLSMKSLLLRNMRSDSLPFIMTINYGNLGRSFLYKILQICNLI